MPIEWSRSTCASRRPALALLTLCAATALSPLVLPRVARACGSTPCALQTDVMPADGSAAVPTNTELRVLYLGTLSGNAPSGASCALPLSRMRLVAEGGESVELEATMAPAGETEAWMVARPDPALMPDTRYALEVFLSPTSDCACDGAREWTRVTAFTTGAAADQEPPSWSGVVEVRAGERVETSNTCGSSDGWMLDVDFEPADDASPGVRYDIFVDGALATRYVEDLSGEMFVDCGSATLFTSTVLQPGARIELQAIDLAGNTSPASSIEHDDVRCDDDPVSAGTGGGSGSCSATSSTRGSRLPAALLALFFMVVVGRSDRRR